MRVRLLTAALLLLLAGSAAAQRPIAEPDNFTEPAMLDGPLFISRLVVGGVLNFSDRFRPVSDAARLVMLTNSFHYNQFQVDYNHAEFIGVESETLRRCDCPEPVYFPTPPPARATPAGPLAARSETVQVAFYRTAGERPVTLRYSFAVTRRKLDTTVISPQQVPEHRFGRDQSFTLDADTHFSTGGHEVWGTLYFAHASTSGMPAGHRAQNEVGYVYRPAGFAAGPLLLRGEFTVGGISGRGATGGVNLVNPYLEAIWRHQRTKVTVRAIWSGEWTRSGIEGWQHNDQVALVLDRTLFMKTFSHHRRTEPADTASAAASAF